MKFAIMAAHPAPIARAFAAAHRRELQGKGAELSLILVDENASKQRNLFRHSYQIAKRQGRIAGCGTIRALIRIIFAKCVAKLSAPPSHEKFPALPDDLNIVKVPTLNSVPAIQAVAEAKVDLICLMGTRILTAATLSAINRPAINIHSSDPRFMRGSQSIACEILDGRDAIVLTIHKVVPQLDAGDILLQREHPIQFCGGIGATLAETFYSAVPAIGQLFADAILGLQGQQLQPKPFVPGPLMVTLSVPQTIRLELCCRRRTNASRSRARASRRRKLATWALNRKG